MTFPALYIIPKERVGSLIDAIYAISMTLLVLSVDIPSKYEYRTAAEPVHSILMSVAGDLVHFFIAFALLAILWYFEHQRFRYLHHLDRPLLVMSIGSLAFVCLLPFCTNLAGDYPFDHLGAIIIELNIFILGTIALLQWIHIRYRSADLVPSLNSRQVLREILWSAVFPVLSVAAIVLAILHVPYSLGVYALAPFIMAYLFWEDPVLS
jgi:uncharacterized membrane protein